MYHLMLDQTLEGVDLLIRLPLNQLHLSESTFADDLETSKVIDMLLGAEESQVLSFCAAHLVHLLLLARLGKARISEELLKIQGTATVKSARSFSICTSWTYRWLRSRAR